MAHPYIGVGMAIVELAVALTVIGTALFGSPELSERAFRLLRWITNRAEPPLTQPLPGVLRTTETSSAAAWERSTRAPSRPPSNEPP